VRLRRAQKSELQYLNKLSKATHLGSIDKKNSLLEGLQKMDTMQLLHLKMAHKKLWKQRMLEMT